MISKGLHFRCIPKEAPKVTECAFAAVLLLLATCWFDDGHQCVQVCSLARPNAGCLAMWGCDLGVCETMKLTHHAACWLQLLLLLSGSLRPWAGVIAGGCLSFVRYKQLNRQITIAILVFQLVYLVAQTKPLVEQMISQAVPLHWSQRTAQQSSSCHY
jgi:hypothetical protein